MSDDGPVLGRAGMIRRVALKNYRSIPACDVRVGPLTFLVGPNGAGKSNFVDALRFVSEALTTTLDHAIRDRGGINEVRRRSSGHPTHMGVRLDLVLPSGERALYAFEIAALAHGEYEVRREYCALPYGAKPVHFEVDRGVVTGTGTGVLPPAQTDRLYLVAASGLEPYRPVFDLLSSTGFYNINPARVKELQAPDAGLLLRREGDNLASVLGRMALDAPETKARIEEFLAQIVPGVVSLDRHVLGPRETIEFRQRVPGAAHPWHFLALNMSDGTLRAAGILVALFQQRSALVAIEEPETALHPAAAAVLYDALREASESRQVLVTSHSPELLDNPGVRADDIRAVEAANGATEIGSVSEGDRKVLAEELYTAGELLRIGQLTPEPSEARQLDLFALA